MQITPTNRHNTPAFNGLNIKGKAITGPIADLIKSNQAIQDLATGNDVVAIISHARKTIGAFTSQFKSTDDTYKVKLLIKPLGEMTTLKKIKQMLFPKTVKLNKRYQTRFELAQLFQTNLSHKKLNKMINK